MTTATPAAGGSLVATNLLAENFVDALRNRLAVYQAGRDDHRGPDRQRGNPSPGGRHGA